jgi:hypothetical protein
MYMTKPKAIPIREYRPGPFGRPYPTIGIARPAARAKVFSKTKTFFCKEIEPSKRLRGIPMFSVESYIHSFATETAICIRLFAKMPPGGLDYRPTPGQRSTLELLRYLTVGPGNGVRRILAGDWSLGRPAAEATKEMPPSDFPRNLLAQSDAVARLLRAADPTALDRDTFTFPWGEVATKGDGLVNHPLKWLVGYRMQLYLYLKAAGAKDLATKHLWYLSKD